MLDKLIVAAALAAGTALMTASVVSAAGPDAAAFVVAKNGADDGAKADDRGRGGHGRDDGPNHTSLSDQTAVAKNGADDGNKADDRGRGGHGRDDGPNHG